MTNQYASTLPRPRVKAAASPSQSLMWLAMIIGLERLCHYGSRYVLTDLLVGQLDMTRTSVSPLFTNIDALLCVLPLVGAFIADRYWGFGRARLAGGVILLLGQLVLVGASLLHAVPVVWVLMGVGLALQVTGNALLAPALYASAGRLLPRDDVRHLLLAFVLLTLFVVVGAFMSSMLLIPLASAFGPQAALVITVGSAVAAVLLLLLPRLIPQLEPAAAAEVRPTFGAWAGPAAALLLLTGGGAWWLLHTGPAWVLQLLGAVLVLAALIYSSYRAAPGTMRLVVALMVADVLVVALMVLMPGLSYDGQQLGSYLGLGLMVGGDLLGLLLLWLWVSQQRQAGPVLLRRLLIACAVVLGASALLWGGALLLNTTPAAAAETASANSWVLALVAMGLLYPGNNVLNVLLPTVTVRQAPARQLALLIAVGFVMSRLGAPLGDLMLTWLQNS